MAQTFTATSCQTNASGFFLNPPKYIENGQIVRTCVINLNSIASATASAVIQMVPVPRGASINEVKLTIDAAGSATYILNVGDGTTNNRFITVSTASVGSATVRMNNPAGDGYSYSADDTIDITMGGAGTTSAQGVVRLTVWYSMDQATDGNS